MVSHDFDLHLPNTVLTPVPMYGVFFHTSKQFSEAPAGCPTTQFNSDTVYLEIESGPTG